MVYNDKDKKICEGYPFISRGLPLKWDIKSYQPQVTDRFSEISDHFAQLHNMNITMK